MTELCVFCIVVFAFMIFLCVTDYIRVNREYYREMKKIEDRQ